MAQLISSEPNRRRLLSIANDKRRSRQSVPRLEKHDGRNENSTKVFAFLEEFRRRRDPSKEADGDVDPADADPLEDERFEKRLERVEESRPNPRKSASKLRNEVGEGLVDSLEGFCVEKTRRKTQNHSLPVGSGNEAAKVVFPSMCRIADSVGNDAKLFIAKIESNLDLFLSKLETLLGVGKERKGRKKEGLAGILVEKVERKCRRGHRSR